MDDPKLCPNAVVVPNPDNILEWHFAVFGLDEPYKGGVYHGVVILPASYPKAPPGIEVYTPNGRFQTHRRLCLSISDWHPESWNTSWQVYQVILGLISVMSEDVEFGIGMIMESQDKREKYAKDSVQFNMQNAKFKELFSTFYDKLGISDGTPAQNNEESKAANDSEPNQTVPAFNPIDRYNENQKRNKAISDYLIPLGTVTLCFGTFYMLYKRYN